MNKSINNSILKYFLLGLSSGFAGIFVFNLNPVVAKSESCKDVNVSLHQAQSPDSSNQDSEEGIDAGLLKQRIVIISQEIDADLAQTIIGQLLYLDTKAPGKDIYLYINSPGGDIPAGMAIAILAVMRYRLKAERFINQRLWCTSHEWELLYIRHDAIS